MRYLASLLLLASFALPAAAQDNPGEKPVKKRRQANLITVEEIDEIRTEASDAYDIIKRLRPQFLRGRGANSFGNAAGGRMTATPRVIVDGAPQGELNTLSQIPAMNVREIRYLNSGDATIQFGTGYDGGAILVFTR